MKYIAIDHVAVHAGARVRLSKEQAERCVGLVSEPEKKGGYVTVLTPFQFKRGETFDLDADLPKSMAEAVERKTGKEPATGAAAEVKPDAAAGAATNEASNA